MKPISVRVSDKDATGKRLFIKSYRINAASSRKVFGQMRGCAEKKSCRGKMRSLASWTDLSSSGESEFIVKQDIGKMLKEFFIIKDDMLDDVQAVGGEGKFIGITEGPIIKKLFEQKIGGSMEA